jgi:benzoylformate decarboxylase
MDRLAERAGGDAPWPQFADVDIAGVARAFGCESRRIEQHDELLAALDEIVPDLAARSEPLLLDVAIAPTATFAP